MINQCLKYKVPQHYKNLKKQSNNYQINLYTIFRRYCYFYEDGAGDDGQHNLKKSTDYSDGYEMTRTIFKDSVAYSPNLINCLLMKN